MYFSGDEVDSENGTGRPKVMGFIHVPLHAFREKAEPISLQSLMFLITPFREGQNAVLSPENAYFWSTSV